MKYDHKHFKFIQDMREERFTWAEVASMFNGKFGANKTHDALRHAMAARGLMETANVEEIDHKLIREQHSAKKNSAISRSKMKKVLEAWDQQDGLLESFEGMLDSYEMPQVDKPVKLKQQGDKMIIELVISDLHYGKLTDTFNNEIARKRMCELRHVLINEIYRAIKTHHVTGIVIACLGDVIENSLMHGPESVKSCETGNSEQVVWAIESIFNDLLLHLGQFDIPITFVGVTGNHDRPEQQKTFIKPGVEHLTYVIYKTLKMLCESVGMNIKFFIPEDSFHVLDIFGDKVLYDHGDRLKSNKEDVVRNWVARRQQQLGLVLDYYRFGHWHGPVTYGRGKYIGNGSLCGTDGFSKELGYVTEATQTINFYCKSDTRPTSFYKTFQVYLEGE